MHLRLWMSAVLLTACAGETSDDEAECVPGESVACIGPAGCEGGQICIDGSSYGECDCEMGGTDGDSDADRDGGDDHPGDGGRGGEDGGAEGDGDGDSDADTRSSDAAVECRGHDECDNGDPCYHHECLGGECSYRLWDGRRYGEGTCYGGEICSGCWDGSSCQVGSPSMCGTAGALCLDCDDGNPCTDDICRDGRACDNLHRDGLACPEGVCRHKTCEVCGAPGQLCCEGETCNSGSVCDQGTCESCGNNGEACCDAEERVDACPAPDLTCVTGDWTCEPCGERHERCCMFRTERCGPSLECTSSTCECGGLGQVCCAGLARDQCESYYQCRSGRCSR